MPQKLRRPPELIFIIIYTFFISLVHLYGGYAPVFKGAANGLVLFLGLLYFIMGLAGYAAVAGLWKWFPWASGVARLIYLISIPLALWDLILNPVLANVGVQLFNIGLNVWVIWYLSRPETRSLFNRAGSRSG